MTDDDRRDVLALIAQAKKAHEDAGNSDFHQGAVAVCEELERVLAGSVTCQTN